MNPQWVTAIATSLLCIVTYLYIRELKKEREFRLKKEHTEEIKNKIIKPLIKEFNNFDIKNRPIPHVIYRQRGYRGEALQVESHILFEDFLKYHAKPSLKENYNEFKEYCRELYRKKMNLRKDLQKFVEKELKIKVLDWDTYYRDGCPKFGFYENKQFYEVLLKLLFSQCQTVEVNYEEKNTSYKGHIGIVFSIKCNGEKIGVIEYIHEKETVNKKEMLIKEEISNIVKKIRKRFLESADGIIEVYNNIKEKHSYILKELEKLNHKPLFTEKCDFFV